MTLSLNCKDAGDPICTHTVYGETEKELIENAREHGTETHGYTEEDWQKQLRTFLTSGTCRRFDYMNTTARNPYVPTTLAFVSIYCKHYME
jgi:predicted small metal-binding protein